LFGFALRFIAGPPFAGVHLKNKHHYKHRYRRKHYKCFAALPHRIAMNNRTTETQIVKNAVAARAGVTGHYLRYVLAARVMSTIIAFCLLGYYFFR
jgi:hypothetical protein